MTKARFLFSLLAALAISATPSHAEEPADTQETPLWGLQLVAFGQSFPAYPSSSDQNLTVLPIPLPIYRGRFFRVGENLENLASGQIYDSNRLKFSIGVSAGFPEGSDDLSARAGMPDLDFLIEAGPEVRYSLYGNREDDRELALSLQLRGAVSLEGRDTHGRGVVLNPELEYLVRDLLGAKTELRFRLSPRWASRDYMNYFFGVAPQFAASGRPVFDARAGYLNTELLLGIRRKISDRLEFRGSARLWLNKGATNKTSPLYQRDYDRGLRLALFWMAWESKQR